MAMEYTPSMSTRPNCQQTRYQVKDGFTPARSQRVHYQPCGQRYTPTPKLQGYADHMRSQALKMYVDRLNFRRIARLLGIHHSTVINWVKRCSGPTSRPLSPMPTHVATVELDELYTFVEEKKTVSTS